MRSEVNVLQLYITSHSHYTNIVVYYKETMVESHEHEHNKY